MSAGDYARASRGEISVSDRCISRVADFFEVRPEELLTGAVDFRGVAIRKGRGRKELPEAYSVAAFGKRRTTITSFDYIQERFGWKVRAELLRRFDLNEAILSDFTAPINMQFMTDVAEFLRRRHLLSYSEFFRMGAHSPVGNRATLIGVSLSAARSLRETYEMLFDGLIRHFEQNTKYTIERLDDQGCTIEVISYPYVAEALGVRHLGNQSLCQLKAGFLASVPLYQDLPLAHVDETSCVHRGDATCRYELTFSELPSGGSTQLDH